MSRKNSPVVSPQPATSILRRSRRLISLQNRPPAKDLSFNSEPPRKIRRKLGPEAKKPPGSNNSRDALGRFIRVSKRGFSDAGKEKSSPLSCTKPASTPSSSFTLRRSPRFSSGGGRSLYHLQSGNSVLSRCRANSCGGDGVRSRDTSRTRPQTKPIFIDCDDDDEEEASLCLNEGNGNGVRSKDISRSRPCPNTKPIFIDCDEEEKEFSLSLNEGKGNSVRSKGINRSSPKTKQILRDCGDEEVSLSINEGKGNAKDISRSRPCPKTKQLLRDCDEEEEASLSLNEGKRNGKDISRSRRNTKQILRDCDDEEVSLGLNEGKRMRLAKENDLPKADQGKRIEKEEVLKTKNESGWTEELELALQRAYLTVKPSPNFWKKVSKMVPGKSAKECFDRVNADLITPRQTQPRSRARKSNLSPIPQFSLSASKLLKPNSPKTKKIRHRKGKLSKKTIRHLVEKQNHMDQGLGFDLFSVLEPGATSNFLSTPTEKGKSLPRIIESPMLGSSKDQTSLVSPPVLKQVKNKALHEKYIDHLHVREAKRKAEYTRLVGKENVRPIDNQKNDSVRAAKDALLFDVQDAIQKLKSVETEKSSSSSEFCYGLGETDEEDESI